jgi:chromosome segregation ATPase
MRRTPSSSRGYLPDKPYNLLHDPRREKTRSRLKAVRVSKDDVNDLKIEKQQLIDERTQLKAKIVRLEAQSKRSTRAGTSNKNLLTQLDKEYKSVEHLVMQQRAQINQLLRSDNAAERQELQEEAKNIYQERLRLQDLQLQQQKELSDAKMELDELLRTNGPAIYEKQNQKIKVLEDKLMKYENANARLAEKIRKLKEEKRTQDESQAGQINSRADQLRMQIKEVEDKTAEIEEKIRASKENHEKVMDRIRQSIIDQGSDQNL